MIRCRFVAMIAISVLVLASCADRRAGINLSDPIAESPTPTPTFVPSTRGSSSATSSTADAQSGERGAIARFTPDGREIISVAFPLIPAIELPAIGDLAETGQLAAQRLSGLVTTAISGVDVVAASCAADGGELVYGDAGDQAPAALRSVHGLWNGVRHRLWPVAQLT